MKLIALVAAFMSWALLQALAAQCGDGWNYGGFIGPLCCSRVGQASDPQMALLLQLFNVSVPDTSVVVGMACSPLSLYMPYNCYYSGQDSWRMNNAWLKRENTSKSLKEDSNPAPTPSRCQETLRYGLYPKFVPPELGLMASFLEEEIDGVFGSHRYRHRQAFNVARRLVTLSDYLPRWLAESEVYELKDSIYMLFYTDPLLLQLEERCLRLEDSFSRFLTCRLSVRQVAQFSGAKIVDVAHTRSGKVYCPTKFDQWWSAFTSINRRWAGETGMYRVLLSGLGTFRSCLDCSQERSLPSAVGRTMPRVIWGPSWFIQLVQWLLPHDCALGPAY
ncbi:hypothetical protein BKA70DRAFT_1401381 [Coprinopsis sp. MPI-PUGE-AT-0042]|nr:hypothetical protein BKA70DRAFT_1401381 [Coprinopsis sp. MPI-PUGE-AT-0042]